MPIYEYACSECGHRFEVRQSFSDDPLESCTNCGARVRRVLHPAGVIFKGSGWYITDSRASGNGAAAEGAAAKADSTASDAASAGESKPTAKAEPTAAKKESAPVAAAT